MTKIFTIIRWILGIAFLIGSVRSLMDLQLLHWFTAFSLGILLTPKTCELLFQPIEKRFNINVPPITPIIMGALVIVLNLSLSGNDQIAPTQTTGNDTPIEARVEEIEAVDPWPSLVSLANTSIEAYKQAQNSGTVATWETAVTALEETVAGLESIPSSHPKYVEAQTAILPRYRQSLTNAQLHLTKAQNPTPEPSPTPTPQPSPIPSSTPEPTPPQPSPIPTPRRTPERSEIRQPVRGSCQCPYDTDSAGRRCGERSAYSKPGGEQPRCYSND